MSLKLSVSVILLQQQEKQLTQKTGTQEWGHDSDKAGHVVSRLLELVCRSNGKSLKLQAATAEAGATWVGPWKIRIPREMWTVEVLPVRFQG